jgi:hypothetical protein
MPNISHYDVGDYWQPQATFTVGGTPADPTTLTVMQQAPDGTETVLANAVSPGSLNASSTPVARVSAGVFKLNPGIAMTTGHWYVKFTGTGTAAASAVHEAIGNADPFASESGISSRALVTLAEAKDWLNQQGIDFDEDNELVRVINDLSDRAHQEAQREFKVVGSNPQTRDFPVDDYALVRGEILIGDATAITQVQLIDNDWSSVVETVDAADWQARPMVRQPWEPIRRIKLNYLNGASYLRGGYLVRVTGSWGFPQVPQSVRQAVLDGIAAAVDRDVEHYRQDLGAVSSQEGQGGNVIMIGGGGQRILSMPPTSLAALWAYRDPLVA